MTPDTSECNGGGVEVPPAEEHEAKGDLGLGPAGDLEKHNDVASPDGGNEYEGGEVGPPLVILNGSSDDLSEKGFGRQEKVELANGNENDGSPVNAGSAVGEEAGGNHEDGGEPGEGELETEHGSGNRPSYAEDVEPCLYSETQNAGSAVGEEAARNHEDGSKAGVGELEAEHGVGNTAFHAEDVDPLLHSEIQIANCDGELPAATSAELEEGSQENREEIAEAGELGEGQCGNRDLSEVKEEGMQKKEEQREIILENCEGVRHDEGGEPEVSAELGEGKKPDAKIATRMEEAQEIGEETGIEVKEGSTIGEMEEPANAAMESNLQVESETADGVEGGRVQEIIVGDDNHNTPFLGRIETDKENQQSSLSSDLDKHEQAESVSVHVDAGQVTAAEDREIGDQQQGSAAEVEPEDRRNTDAEPSDEGQLQPISESGESQKLEGAATEDESRPLNLLDDDEKVDAFGNRGTSMEFKTEADGQAEESAGSHDHGLCSASVAGDAESSDILLDLEPAKEGGSSFNIGPSETSSSTNIPDNSEKESVRLVACTPGDEQVVEESVGSPCNHGQVEESVGSHGNHGLLIVGVAGNSESSGLLLYTTKEGEPADQVESPHARSSVNTGPSETSIGATVPESSEEESVRIAACAPGDEKVVEESVGSFCNHGQAEVIVGVATDAESSDLLDTAMEGEPDQIESSHPGSSVSTGPSETSSSANIPDCSEEESVRIVACAHGDEAVDVGDSPVQCDGYPTAEAEARRPVYESSPSNHVSEDINSQSVSSSITRCAEGVEILPVSAHDTAAMESKVCHDKEAANQEDAAENLPLTELESRAPHDTVEIGKCSIQEGDKPTTKLDRELTKITEEADEAQATLEDSSRPVLDGDKPDTQLLKRQPCYIIKIPRFAGEETWAQKQDAELQLDEKTQIRDSIQILIKKKKVACDDARQQLHVAKTDEKAAKDLCNAKRQEINSVQSIINKLNKATSIEEIAEKIAMKERSLQHETLSLKQEKMFIQEIKELKAQQKQLSSNVGSKEEMDEAFDQKDQIYERLKNLKREHGLLGCNLATLEGITKVAQSKYDDEREELRRLQDQFRAADEVRQKAYGHWRDLKTESVKKSKYFFMYKDDQKVVSKYLSLGDTKGLWSYCNKQIERVMELWNTNDEFRKQYIESNKNSTLRRLKTLDGRSLGPDEDPPIVNTNTNKRSNSFTPHPTSASPTPTVDAKVELVSEKDPFPALQPSKISQHGNPNLPTKEAVEEINSAGKDNAREMEDKEEADLARKAELLKREEESRMKAELLEREEESRKKAAVEKEQLRLEQRAKAVEAEERKRRKAEKAQERAEYKARKEAEIRDKKKAKKEKKKATGTSDTANGVVEGGSDISTDNNMPDINREPETPAATGSSKRHSRPVIPPKQLNRVQPLPLPLRNRGRRKMYKWMLIAVLAVLAAALIVGFGYVFFSSSSLFSSQI